MKFFDAIKAKFTSGKFKELSQKFFQDGHDKLLKDLNGLQKDNPEDMRVKQKIAETLFKKGDTDGAVLKFREIADYFEKEQFILKAIRACKSVLKIRPADVDINLRLAALYVKIDMIPEAGNQYRIAINHYATRGERAEALSLAQDLVKIDPSNANRIKLAEIYQNNAIFEEAVKQYEILAKDYRSKKQYDDLLRMYERILPYRPDNTAILKDVCILHLRQQKPDKALKLIDLYKREGDPQFADLITKGRLMIDAIKKQNKPVKK